MVARSAAIALQVLLALAPGLVRAAQEGGGDGASQEQTDAAATQSAPGASAKATGVISGQVLGDGGQPLFNAEVRLQAAGKEWGVGSRTAASDEQGRFKFEGIEPTAFSVTADANGYVLDDDTKPAYRYAGDAVTLKLAKGGVVTGKVTNANGEPVVAVAVSAILVKDRNGKPPEDIYPNQERTDDRGIYRIYGLQNGVYIVGAGGSAEGGWGPISFTAGDTTTYYPSANIDTASPLDVRTGQELSGIDIVYRGEAGHKITGVVVGADGKRGWVRIKDVRTKADGGYSEVKAKDGTFESNALSDGEYEVTASVWEKNETTAAAEPVPVKISGSDVNGVRVVLVPLGKVSGRFALESSAVPKEPAEGESACPAKSVHVVQESIVGITREVPGDRDVRRMSVSKDGSFELKSLTATRYTMRAWLPDPGWYVKSISRVEPGKPKPSDVARDGIAVGPGKTVEGITVTVAGGAAHVTGQVKSAKDGASLPDSMKVHLVPAEPTATDANGGAIRFYDVEVDRDGSFELKNLAPGAYRAVVLPFDRKKPLDRVAIRKAAASGHELTLAPCADEKGLTLTP